jgi:hypothetical protein
LRLRGLRTWIDSEGLRLGESLTEKIADAICAGDYVITLISKAALDSPWCREELSIALTEGIARRKVVVLPLRVGDVAMPPSLRGKLWLQLDETNIEEVVDKITLDVIGYASEPSQI